MMKLDVRPTGSVKPAGVVSNKFVPNDSREEYKNGYCQWLVEGDMFVAITKTERILPAGFYNIRYDRAYDRYTLVKSDPIIDELIRLPNKVFDEILNDIDNFWNSEAMYREYDYVYKRGILIYGAQGLGKSSLVMLIANMLTASRNGIVLNIRQSDDILQFDEIFSALREVEPNRNVIITIEDIDNFVTNDQELMTKLLNILDGNMQHDNIVTIATTNNPDKLGDRLTNRPSRFDVRREMTVPNAIVRDYYIRNKLKPRDLKKINMEDLVKTTAGYSIDHLKELLLMIHVLKYDKDHAVNEVNNMINNGEIAPPSLKNTQKLGYWKVEGMGDMDGYEQYLESLKKNKKTNE